MVTGFLFEILLYDEVVSCFPESRGVELFRPKPVVVASVSSMGVAVISLKEVFLISVGAIRSRDDKKNLTV